MLIKYEFHKYFTRFNMILLAFLLTLNIGLTVLEYWDFFGSEQKEIWAAKEKLINLYLTDKDTYAQIYENHLAQVAEYEGSYYKNMYSGEAKTIAVFENSYIDFENYGDVQLFREVEETLRTPDEYKRKMTSLVRDSVLRLEESDEDSYICKYYIELCSHYTLLANQEFDIVQTRGWNEYFSLKIPNVLLAIALISTLCGTFTNDRRAGMNNLLHVSKHGGKATRRAKLVVIGVISAVVTLVFTLIPLVIFIVTSGLSPVNQPIQTLVNFQYCPYDITIGQYLILFVLLRTAFFTVLSLFAAIVSQIFENENFAFLTIGVLFISGILLGKIAPSSEYYFLQKFSISELAGVNILFTRYRGLNIMNQCVNYNFFMICGVLLLTVLLIMISIFHKDGDAEEFSSKKPTGKYTCATMSLVGTEFYKHLLCNKLIYVVLAAVLLQCIISGFYYSPATNYSERQYMDYITQISGAITKEKLQKIEDESKYIETSISDYEKAVADYRNGKISHDEYQSYQNRYNYAQYCENASNRLCERRDYLLSISEIYPDVEFIYDEGIDRYFNISFDLAAVIVMLLLGSSIFACEYESGFGSVMRTTKKGRKNIFRAKYLYSIISTICLYLIFALISAGFIGYYYDVNFWKVPVQSLPRFADIELYLSVAEYLVLYQAISFFGYIACFLLVCSLSAVMKSQMKAVITAMVFILLPYFIHYIQIINVNILNYLNMISPQNIKIDLISYVSCVAVTLLSVIIANKKWCGRRC